MSDSIKIRPAETADLPFLWEMLYEAAAISKIVREMGKERALALPVMMRALEDFGRKGDFGFVAENEKNELIGAVWARLFPEKMKGYGFISPEIPELSIAVTPEYRGRGVGTKLLEALIERARELNFQALSLAVFRSNPAFELYRRTGFRDAGVPSDFESSVTMILKL